MLEKVKSTVTIMSYLEKNYCLHARMSISIFDSQWFCIDTKYSKNKMNQEKKMEKPI